MVSATPSRVRIFAATSAAHGVPGVFVATIATSTGRSPSRSGARVRSTPCPGSRRASARSLLRQAPLQREELALLHREAVLVRRERAVADLTIELAQRADRGGADVGVALGELRLELAVEAKHVVQHEHLAIAVHAGADTDRGDRELLSGERADRRRHALEDDRKRARIFEREGVVDQPPRRASGLRLHLEAAELRHALRGEADVRHDRDAVRGERADRLDYLRAALDLDRVHAGFLEEPGR